MTDIISTPKNPSRKPYIYKVTNFETDQYYIGSQCSGKIVGVNYFTSSTNKKFKEDFKTYREEKYEITIIKEFDDPKECVRAENYIIRNYIQKRDDLCLNMFCCCGKEKIFSTVGIHHSEETRKKMSVVRKGIHHSEETRKKISETKKGIPSPLKGIHHSEETGKKISEAKKGVPSPLKGIHRSEETRKKISEAKKGIHRSEETRKKISEAHKIKISIEGTIFNSLTEASKYYNVDPSTIRRWVKNKKHHAIYIEK